MSRRKSTFVERQRKAEEGGYRVYRPKLRKAKPRPKKFACRRVQYGVFVPIVYFIQVGADGPVKIGKTSKDPRERLCDLQIGMPFDLRIRAVMLDETLGVEDELHGRFSHLHIRGEWYRPAEELIGFIDSHACVWEAVERSFGGRGLVMRSTPGRRIRDEEELIERDLLMLEKWCAGHKQTEVATMLNVTKALVNHRLSHEIPAVVKEKMQALVYRYVHCDHLGCVPDGAKDALRRLMRRFRRERKAAEKEAS
jgi:hypothetical protein